MRSESVYPELIQQYVDTNKIKGGIQMKDHLKHYKNSSITILQVPKSLNITFPLNTPISFEPDAKLKFHKDEKCIWKDCGIRKRILIHDKRLRSIDGVSFLRVESVQPATGNLPEALHEVDMQIDIPDVVKQRVLRPRKRRKMDN